jgi:hypothetical protein
MSTGRSSANSEPLCRVRGEPIAGGEPDTGSHTALTLSGMDANMGGANLQISSGSIRYGGGGTKLQAGRSRARFPKK